MSPRTRGLLTIPVIRTLAGFAAGATMLLVPGAMTAFAEPGTETSPPKFKPFDTRPSGSEPFKLDPPAKASDGQFDKFIPTPDWAKYLTQKAAEKSGAEKKPGQDNSEELCMSQEPDEAVKGCSIVIMFGDPEPATYFNRGNAYLELGKYDAALEDLDAGIRLSPDDARYRAARAAIHVEMEDYAKAAADFAAAQKLSGGEDYKAEARRYEALAANAGKDDGRRADDCLKPSIDKKLGTRDADRKFEITLNNDCAFAIVAGVFGKTEKGSARLVPELPANPEGADGPWAVWQSWGIDLGPTETPEKFLEGLELMAVKKSDFVEMCGRVTGKSDRERLLCMADVSRAKAEEIEDAALNEAKEAAARKRRAKTEQDLALCKDKNPADPKEAVEACTRLIELGFKDPNEPEAKKMSAAMHFFRGINRGKLRDYDQALQDFDTAISLSPDDGAPYFFRAVTQAKLGHMDEALEDRKKACSMDKQFCK